MNPLIQIKTITLSLLIVFMLACFALLPEAQAVTPAPDGGYAHANTAEGQDALLNLDAGIQNTAIGYHALFNNTEGNSNTAVGESALEGNTTGVQNTATGDAALLHNGEGSGNTATGCLTLPFNSGDNNTATGAFALGNIDGSPGNDGNSGDNNTATGAGALFGNITGNNNTANGYLALQSNTQGDNNTANGFQALYSNVDGNDNIATGLNALFSNTSGSENTANGHNALQGNTTGHDNTADGHDALFNSTGSENIAVGHGAGQNLTTGDNNIDIGNSGVAGEANTIRIGNPGFFVEPGVLVGGHKKTFIFGISGTALGAGVAVRVNSAGQLGTAPSSARFKQNIKAMGDMSDALFALRPVTFRYKKEFDSEGIQQFGLVAEEVEKVNPYLVARDSNGKPYTVRYEAVNAMLLNEFLKEHRKVQQLTKDFESKFAEQQKQIEALTAGLQKVSAQVEMNRTAQQMVVNNQ
jgi:hypothetical protein